MKPRPGWFFVEIFANEFRTDGNNHTRAGLRRCQARAMSGTIVRMSFTELTEAFFMKSAGWEAVKNARSLLAAGKVISSN